MLQTGNPDIDESTHSLIAGSDEAGRGNWAGPLVTAVVCVPQGWKPPPGVTDSKQVKDERKRFQLRDALLRDKTISWCVLLCHPEVIDQTGVHQANIREHRAVHRALRHQNRPLRKGEALHIADGNLPFDEEDEIVSLPKADALIPAVSAASILAKTALDEHMREMGRVYPGYDFGSNKGYGSPTHAEALKRLGPCPIHRRSFEPVRAALKPAKIETCLDLFAELPEEA